MDRLCIRATECNYKEHDRSFKEQLINGINNEEITQEIMKELMFKKIHKKYTVSRY